MLVVLVLIITELSVKFVQSVFQILNVSVALTNFIINFIDLISLLSHYTVLAINSLFIVINFCMQNIYSLVKSIKVLFKFNLNFSKSCKFLIIFVGDVFLLVAEFLLVLDFLS